MSFNIIEASKNITKKYKRYLHTIFDIKDPEYKRLFEQRLENDDSFSKGPYIDVVDSFSKGLSVKELIDEGVLCADFAKIDDIYNKTLYVHQEQAVRRAVEGRNLVVSTGTGSGKTESFLIPILNALMREKEIEGKLTPGVRALIVYPMNALANDQVDRLRSTLSNYSDITFGCYTGQTEYSYDKALLQYKKLNHDDVTGEEKCPLSNELISREQMKDTPPHILITNYAMLEYFMLRPADNVFFDGQHANHWKFIVLDEAHTYTGSTGIEVAYLLRRVVAQLKNPSIQYILTSATLGDENSNKEVVDFASNLCNATFNEQDIIRAQRISLEQNLEESITLPTDFYEFVDQLLDIGYDDGSVIRKIEEQFGIKSNANVLGEFLFDLLLTDTTYWKVKRFLATPQSVYNICEFMDWDTDELSNFVNVASLASKNRSKLFDARYHLFLKATDGVYITLPPHKNLFLARQKYDYSDDRQYKVFEVASCTQCHSLYILGNTKDGYLEQKSGIENQTIREAFLIGDTISDSDDDDTLEGEKLKTEQYELCPICGFIRPRNMVHKTKCEHDESIYIVLTKVKTSDVTGRVTKCICCESVNRLGILRGFFTGQEASTSVIGTALFEELPDHEKKIVKCSESDNFDGFDDDEYEKVVETTKAKQFLAFSDSRQAAAYFATYFSETYDDMLYGKLVYDLVLERKDEVKPLPNFAKDLSAKFKENRIAPFYDESPDYETEAWKAILKELVDNKSRHSLIGLGLLDVGISEDVRFVSNSKYGLSADEVQKLCLAFVMQMMSDAAIYYNKPMTDGDKEFFTHNGIESTYLSNGANSQYAKSFIPRTDNRSNKRLDYLMRVLQRKGFNLSRDDAIKLLDALWKRFFEREGLVANVTSKGGLAGYRVNTNKLILRNSQKWYICNRCKKLTTINIEGVCPNYMCDGELHEVDVEQVLKDNHYYRMYKDLPIHPMRIVEHTAQLSREEAYNYQNLFKSKKIDVLSCSTTFEMGVDVGELETVFMRNMPPTPANYTQRAGRAGRSAKSAAFAITFCNKSNHDFNFFKNPISMIKGTIVPPAFKVSNEKICIRHVYSSALAFFWRKNEEYFRNASAMVEKRDENGVLTSGYEKFKKYLEQHPQDLKEYLLTCLPKDLIDKFQVESFGWIGWLFDTPTDTYPNFKRVYELYNAEIAALVDDKNKAFANGNSVDYISWRIKNYRDENVISFLSKNSILPKYGFPVDTVELSLANKDVKGGLDLSRDLSMAISEYAPGCQVVANGKLITSRFIRKMPHEHWKMYDYAKCKNCQTLNMEIHTESSRESLSTCKQCGLKIEHNEIKTFIIPDFGFIAERKVEKPTLVKPERTSRTEALFVNYNNDIPESEYEYNGVRVNVATIDNGRMAMLTTDSFFVCQECGYAMEDSENSNPFVKQTKCEHNTSHGTKCKCNNLDKFSLGYTFETDVIRIRIDKPIVQIESAISTLQALILSACSSMNIDNREIAGCLQYYKPYHYSFILYDTTPGGAGHIRRLNSENALHELLRQAYLRAKDCRSCDDTGETSCYDCLRTYQNQRYHDQIKRKYVVEYLEDIVARQ